MCAQRDPGPRRTSLPGRPSFFASRMAVFSSLSSNSSLLAGSSCCSSVMSPARYVDYRIHDRGACCAMEYSMLIRSMPLGVVRQPLQGYDHVLVDLEGVGVGGDGRGACPVQPEVAPRLRDSPRRSPQPSRALARRTTCVGSPPLRRPRRLTRQCPPAAPSLAARRRGALVAYLTALT